VAQAKAIKKPIAVDFEFATEDGEIETLEGKMTYQKGDAIITGVKGEKYPCRRDIFDQTYDIVGNPENQKNEINIVIERKSRRLVSLCDAVTFNEKYSQDIPLPGAVGSMNNKITVSFDSVVTIPKWEYTVYTIPVNEEVAGRNLYVKRRKK
jgi:hypothetical protein